MESIIAKFQRTEMKMCSRKQGYMFLKVPLEIADENEWKWLRKKKCKNVS